MPKRHTQRPLDLDSRQDAARALEARRTLLSLLGADPRVQAAIRDWASTQEAQRCVELFRRMFEAALDSGSPLPEHDPAWEAWETERPRCASVVTEAVDVSCSSEWFGEWLADQALMQVVQEQAEWRSVTFTLEAIGSPGYVGPARRRPKGDGDSIARDVTWFYRARLADPVESVTQLAREYAAEANRTTDARAVVQDGIKRAAALLDVSPLP